MRFVFPNSVKGSTLVGHSKTSLKSPFSPIYSHIPAVSTPPSLYTRKPPQLVLRGIRGMRVSPTLQAAPQSLTLAVDMSNVKYSFTVPTPNHFGTPKLFPYGNSGAGYCPQTSLLSLCFPVCITKFRRILLVREGLQ